MLCWGVQGAAFVCLPAAPGGPGTGGGAGSPGPSSSSSCPAPLLTLCPSWFLLPTIPRPMEMFEAYGDVRLGWLAMPTPSRGQDCGSFFLFDS